MNNKRILKGIIAIFIGFFLLVGLNITYKTFDNFSLNENNLELNNEDSLGSNRGLEVSGIGKPEATSVTSTVVHIEAEIFASGFYGNGTIDGYYLVLESYSGFEIGDSPRSQYTEDGVQEIIVDHLGGQGQIFDNSYIVAYSDEKHENQLAKSPDFSFETPKGEVNALSDPDITTTTASLTTIVSSGNFSNGEVQDYFLEVFDKEGVSKSKKDNLHQNGTQTILVTDLEKNTEYKDWKIEAIDEKDKTKILASTGSFSFKTQDRTISKLENASVKIATSTTATIEVDVIEETFDSNFEYSLEVIDKQGMILGEVTEGGKNLTEVGHQEFKISGLESSASYYGSKVAIVGKHSIQSNPFDITTTTKSVTKLDNERTTDITYKSATVSVDVSSEETFNSQENGDKVNDYKLVATEQKTKQRWESENLNTTGQKEIYLDGLFQDSDYDIVVTVEGTEIKSKEIKFKTKALQFEIVQKSLDITDATRNSFTFNIIIKESSPENAAYKTGDLHLFSNNKELKIKILSHDIGTDKYTYTAKHLKSNYTYNNFSAKTEGSADDPIEMLDSQGNDPYITTKVNYILISESVVSGFLLMIVVIIIALIIWKIRKNRLRDQFTQNIKYSR